MNYVLFKDNQGQTLINLDIIPCMTVKDNAVCVYMHPKDKEKYYLPFYVELNINGKEDIFLINLWNKIKQGINYFDFTNVEICKELIGASK